MNAVSKFGLVFYAKTDEALSGLARMEKHFSSMEMSLLALQGTADHVFTSIKSSLFGWGKALVDEAGKIESTKSMFQFAFKDLPDKGAEAFDKSVDAGLRMVQTTDEVINAVTGMRRMLGVNLFDPKMEKAMKAVNDQGLQFVDLMGDIAAATNVLGGVEGVQRALSEAMVGQWRGVMMNLKVGKEEIAQWKKAVAGAHDNTERLAKLTPLLFKRFGGAAYAQADTWKFLTAQIGDYKDKLFSTLGKPLMDALKPGLRALNEYMVDPQKGLVSRARIHELNQVVAVFGEMGKKLYALVSVLGQTAKFVIAFIKQHPEVIKWAVGVAALTAGFAGLVTTLIAAKVAVFAIGAAFGSAAAPILLVMGTLTAGAAALATWAVHGQSLADTWHKWGAVAHVVSDILGTMNGKIAKISMENAKAADEKGVLGLAIKIGMWVYRVKEFFVALGGGLKAAKDEIKAAFMPVFNQLVAMSLTFGGSATAGVERWREAGVGLARVIVQLVKGFAWLLDGAVRFGRGFVTGLKIVGAVLYYGVVNPAKHLVGYLDDGWKILQKWFPGLQTTKAHFAEILGIVGAVGVSLLAAKKLAGVFGVDLKGSVMKLLGRGSASDPLTGVQKVFVVNMPGGGLGGGLGGLLGPGGKLPMGGGQGMGLMSKMGLLAVAFEGGWAIGDFIANLKDKNGRSLGEAIGDKIWEMFGPGKDPSKHVDADAARKGVYGAKAASTQRYLDQQNDSSLAAQIARREAGKPLSYQFTQDDFNRALATGPAGQGGQSSNTFTAILNLDGKQIQQVLIKRDELDRMRGQVRPDGVPINLAR